MTREKQIRQAGIEYTIKNRPMCIGGGAFSEVVDEMNRNYAFEEGAKWADANPNLSEEEQVRMGELGMMWQKKAFLEKACEWLLDNTGKYIIVTGGGYWFNDIEFIKDLKQAMEE